MRDLHDKSPLEQIIDVLRKHGVEFMVVGGQAEVIFGSPRVTYDTDLCYRRTADNLKRLAAALREIKPSLRGAPPDLPFTLDERALALGLNFTFTTPLGDLDLLGELEPLGGYDKLAPRAEQWSVGGTELLVISLDDLITIKQHINRPKDRDSLYQLLAIKKIRDEQAGR